MERSVRPEITNETSDPEHVGPAGLVVDDRILRLDAVDIANGTHRTIENSAALRNT